MSQVEVTELKRAGSNLRRIGRRAIDTSHIVARAETDHYSVLYLRSGEKVVVREGLEEIERMTFLTETQRETVRRFKREIRECKAMGMSVEQAFAALWEEVATRSNLSESELGNLYQDLLDWVKRWLK